MARTVKCPSCGAELTVKDDNRDFMFCEFCGTKVRLDDYQETHRYVNEAEVQRVKAEKELELKRMEAYAKREEQAGKQFITLMSICLGVALFCVLISRFM
jgi:acetyl-CoA carboxylase beta subunit